jgi:hypothetical protein
MPLLAEERKNPLEGASLIDVTQAYDAPKSATRRVDLSPFHDTETVLRNPHKGWYHHYFDNGIDHYLPSCDEDLTEFPGMDHIYLRLAWSYLEPEQGNFNWRIIDDVIEKWRAKGLTVSFRITCKETDIVYATPEWVKDLGADGEYFHVWNKDSWRPDYGDPIFLEHLDNFHRAFAARYDGQPWVEYIDIGSYGQWGEGHNFLCGDEAPAPFEVVKQHIDIHLKHYKKSLLVVSDDFVGDRADGHGAELAEYIHANNISIRDDSVLVKHYVQHYSQTFTLRSPELFQRASQTVPTVLELQHYPVMKDPKIDHTWIGRNGSVHGGEIFENALRLSRATWIGYHGDAREWLDENPELTLKLANLCGYWLFPETIDLPEKLVAGQTAEIAMSWLNRGVAPPYHPYQLTLRLRGENCAWSQPVLEANPTSWLPGVMRGEVYSLDVPVDLAAGLYDVELCLKESTDTSSRPVWLGLDKSLRTADNFYRVATVEVS